ncbi:hypothetical protein [Citreimonas salinaria]|uniref:Uncharacterized protein n=1 Tax=Citreimonas salinaria TaxID=321339 RepID=A0A1H3NB63_9RHOB|nr:hypothetical protein [Citreimonas salinaria]SDY85910.1 hypothetical protein SAMN05444340_12221 [Citreimonas salinaria]
MNSIVISRVPDVTDETLLHAALSRLGSYLDYESGSLEALLTLTGNEAAINDIEALHALHLDQDATAADIRQLLMQAQTSLVRLLGVVGPILLHATVFERSPSDFDAWLRWSGARLRDISATLSRALVD